MEAELPYGRAPIRIDLTGRDATVVAPPAQPALPPLDALIEAALAALPRVGAGARVTVIVSDATRIEPRAAFVAALRARLPAVHWTLAVATGTHGPAQLDALGLPPALLDGMTVVNHDGHADTDLVLVGTTARGTPVRVHRCVVEADLVIATGCIRPHYFAGFGAGVKAVFPGLGAAAAIRINHALKTQPGARAGIVDGNPCRDDLEEAVALLPAPRFLLNGVCRFDGGIVEVVAGDPVAAHRAGVAVARPLFTASAPRAPLVIASDALPVTASRYQAAKIAAAVAALVEPGGTLALVAECPDGIGPLDVVNEAIFRIGVLPRLAPGVRLVLVSGLAAGEVARTLLAPAPSVASVLMSTSGRVTVVPRASQLLFEPS